MNEEHSGATDGHRTGDKVRVRTGPHAGARGVVLAGEDEFLTLDLGERGSVAVEQTGVTNYSLAARRAWRSMPKRAGRPRSAERAKRMVSLRIDAEVWRMLGAAAELSLIPSREQAVNSWLQAGLQSVLADTSPEMRDRIQSAD